MRRVLAALILVAYVSMTVLLVASLERDWTPTFILISCGGSLMAGATEWLRGTRVDLRPRSTAWWFLATLGGGLAYVGTSDSPAPLYAAIAISVVAGTFLAAVAEPAAMRSATT